MTILDSYEAVGAVLTGAMDEATLARLERSCLPTVGACAGQFTANTMAMVSEALGLSVPNVSMIPGVFLFRMASGLVQLASGSHANVELISATVADGMTALSIILAMSFGLLVPKMAIDAIGERTTRPRF